MTYENKNEKQDASIITILGLTFAGFNLIGVVYYPPYLGIVLISIALMIIANIIWFRSIYFRMNNKYKSGNSYVQRKFKTIGLSLAIFYMLMIILCYLISFINKEIALFIYIIIIIMPIDNVLINKFWYKFDEKKYNEIDKLNPAQKKYWNEPVVMYQNRKKW